MKKKQKDMQNFLPFWTRELVKILEAERKHKKPHKK